MDDERINIGKLGESIFKKWLDTNSIPYIYVDQDIETFAKAFVNKVKRPDFLIVVSGIGLIAIDVKVVQDRDNTVSYEDHEKFYRFRKFANIQAWYVFVTTEEDSIFKFVSTDLIPTCNSKVNSKSQKSFYIVSNDMCNVIENKHGLNELLAMIHTYNMQ